MWQPKFGEQGNLRDPERANCIPNSNGLYLNLNSVRIVYPGQMFLQPVSLLKIKLFSRSMQLPVQVFVCIRGLRWTLWAYLGRGLLEKGPCNQGSENFPNP